MCLAQNNTSIRQQTPLQSLPDSFFRGTITRSILPENQGVKKEAAISFTERQPEWITQKNLQESWISICWEDCLCVQSKMTKSTVKCFQVQPAFENNQFFNISPKQPDVKVFASDERVDRERKSFKNIVEKLKYNRSFYENNATRGIEMRVCAATHLGISRVKHVLLPYNSLTRR